MANPGLTGPLPKISNRSTDVDIPRAVLSPWKEDGKPQTLRRPLTADERRALTLRRDELLPAVSPFAPRERDGVVLALADMFGGFTSMRQGDEDAAARLDSVERVLAQFPAWAIEKACVGIQSNGVWRDGKFDRRWPPNDSEIVHEVRQHLRLYKDSLDRAQTLLDAEVEP